MNLITRLLTLSRRSGGVIRFIGLSLAIFVLAGGVFATNIEIPILVTISLVMLAISLALITIVAYLTQINQPAKLGRIKFTLLISIQPIISLFLLALIYFSPLSYGQKQTDGVEQLLKASAVSMLVFLVLFYLLITYLNKLVILSHASPSMFMGVFLPAALNLTAFITHFSICHCSTSLTGMFITTIVFAYTFFDYRMLFVSPYDRRLIVDAMKLGWVIVDKNELILDANQAALSIFGQTLDQLIGQPGKTLISNWSTLFPTSLLSEKELQASFKYNGRWSYFHIRSLPLVQDGEFIGRIMLWNDITERKEGEDIRKRTMDTTLSLLHSISLAASHSADIRAFLETAIFQIVTGFNCTSGFIFMREFEFIGEEKAQLEQVGSYSVMDLPDTELIEQSLYAFLACLSPQQEIMHMKNSDLPARFEALKSKADMDELMLCPIVIEGQMEGAIILFRSDNTPFLPDEIIRLEMLANELSTLIYVEQQRNGFASMMERRKLTRILHDTVTQQLYGLLYFTDVARAQLESGTIKSLTATLEKLSETGRQILKEMRMFLHSLQPMNMSKTGLVTAINQRLDSVEGRASVKTKFLVADDIKLTLKQEVCLYEIALEALNNILRHAYAKNVTVTLKQHQKNIRLEIVDDGRGFNVDVGKNSGGMGLNNMRESAKQIHAKISIQSSLETGSSVRISFPRTDVLNLAK